MKDTQMIPVSAETLRDFVTGLYQASGLPAEDAGLVADTLVTADLWGHSSHGVMRAPWYIDRLRNGVMRPVTQPRRLVDAGAISVLDAEDGVGQVVAVQAMRDAIRRAKAHGVGVVSVRNSNHHGALGYYTRMAAAEGCIGVLTTNGSPAMAPWGGRKKLVGNNPWSIAAPAGQHAPMMLDIANTVVARGNRRSRHGNDGSGGGAQWRHPADGGAQGLCHLRDDGCAIRRALGQRHPG
jgi:LDH2 family malate/lactate/ureidoglycolate dehydrogenase